MTVSYDAINVVADEFSYEIGDSDALPMSEILQYYPDSNAMSASNEYMHDNCQAVLNVVLKPQDSDKYQCI